MVAALGSRGTGKSAWVRQWIQRTKPARLAVWDYMDEHRDLGPAYYGKHATGLGDAIRAMQAGRRWVVRFVPSRDDKRKAVQFDLWCRACMEAGHLTAWVEELAFVTTAHKAPPGWREMCLVGRHEQHRVSIIGTSQRPAQVDKEFLGNLDLMHCGRLGEEPDAKRVAGRLGVPYRELLTLPDLHYIERDPGQLEPVRGVLSFGGKPARKPPPKGPPT